MSSRSRFWWKFTRLTDAVFTVVAGDNVLLGPDSVGQFIPTTIKSIQRKRVDVDTAEAGQSVS